MQVITSINELRNILNEIRRQFDLHDKIGFVPTMGYLHQGHASLLARARKENRIVVLSIFVNPLQFGPNEDFDRYPRDEERDLALARQEGVDIVFMPSVEEMYPQYPLDTRVTVGNIASRLCGASRPGHFDGVATIVTKLFHIVGPDRAYFGLKDVQQVAVIQQFVRDLNIPVEIVPCPTVREQDGLALSSRNVYLKDSQRQQASILSRAIREAGDRMVRSSVSSNELEALLAETIDQVQEAELDYASVLAYPSLELLEPNLSVRDALAQTVDRQVVIALAVKFGRTRLIDNGIFSFAEVLTHV